MKLLVNQERLWGRLMALAQIGMQEGGGTKRLPFTKEDKAARELVAYFMTEAGLTVTEDAVCNLIGRKEGKNPNAPAVWTGSHIDTVWLGGNFDGALGVLSAIESLQVMHENGIETEAPIEVIAFTNEECTRWNNAMIGSRGMVGRFLETDLDQLDRDGVVLRDAMREAGYAPEAFKQAIRSKETVKAFVELHIEQGKVLETEGLSVGIVKGIYSQLGDKFIVEGEAGHAGATPMHLRKDPLMAASEIMLDIEDQARKGQCVGTIGYIQAFPGGTNIIPGRVEFSVDLRNVDDPSKALLEQEVIAKAKIIAEKRGVKLTVEKAYSNGGVPCDPAIQEIIKDSCETAGLKPFNLMSGAGHDAMHIAALCPIGMIFVRSKDGVSHAPLEYSSPEDCRDGANVLYHTLLELAK
ncbi:allantoate deiminase/N-carbamoyl-L-amino-acid hydrolase [Desulfitobacterium sp. LBE]|nr:allantoate deiminase/N-carbamoyl-L-amino-acid hydrolase [Desulfitobacterium sp. LBE]